MPFIGQGIFHLLARSEDEEEGERGSTELLSIMGYAQISFALNTRITKYSICRLKNNTLWLTVKFQAKSGLKKLIGHVNSHPPSPPLPLLSTGGKCFYPEHSKGHAS